MHHNGLEYVSGPDVFLRWKLPQGGILDSVYGVDGGGDVLIYIDTPGDFSTARSPTCFQGKVASHLTADTEEELLKFAISLGMRPEWAQRFGTRYFHFDVMGEKLRRVLADHRVKVISRKEMVTLMQSRGAGS